MSRDQGQAPILLDRRVVDIDKEKVLSCGYSRLDPEEGIIEAVLEFRTGVGSGYGHHDQERNDGYDVFQPVPDKLPGTEFFRHIFSPLLNG